MHDLNKYYTMLFKKAHRLDTNILWIEIILFCLVVISNFFSEYILYIIASLGVLIQIIAYIIHKQQHEIEGLAHRLQEYAMLYEYYGRDTFNFDISQIKGKVPLSIHNQVKKLSENPESSQYTARKGDMKELIQMLQENCFWNYHLYRYCYWASFIKVIFWTAPIALFFLFFIGNSIITPDFLIPRILLAFLSVNLLWKEIDKILLWYKSATTMLVLDNEIERQKTFEEDFLVHTFAQYHLAKSSAPLIKDEIYNQLQEKLNHAWKSRFNLLYAAQPL